MTINPSLFSSKKDDWETPQDLFDKLNEKFKFTLDPCASINNHKCGKYYTKEDDGLKKNWKNEIVFCNPPYNRQIPKWVKKCYEESADFATIVLLIPARVDTKPWHEYIKYSAKICFLKGRLKFINKSLPSYREDGNFIISSSPFPSSLILFKCNVFSYPEVYFGLDDFLNSL